MTTYFLTFAVLTSLCATLSYLQGKTFSFLVNIACAIINLAEFFFWS